MKKLFLLLTLLTGASQALSHGQEAAAAALPKVNITASDPTAFKNLSSGAFTVYRDGTNDVLKVSLAYSGTASNGVDIVALPDSVTIPAGLHAVSLVVQPLVTGVNAVGKSIQASIVTNASYTIGGHHHAKVDVRANAFENEPPTVSISNPADGASFGERSNITIAADVSDPDDNVAKVSIMANDRLIAQFTAKPYSTIWTNVPQGKYALFARAEDTLGKSTLSSPVHISVTNIPPVTTLAITAPTNGSVFSAGSNVKVSASAGAGDAALKSVSFYADDDLIGTATTAPFSVLWTNVASGKYSLVAKGLETSGASSVSSKVKVSATNAVPKVSLTAPAEGAVIALPGNITLKADASASNTRVASVMFFSDNRFLATVTTPPYTYVWTNATPGKHSLLARVTDGFGENAYSSVVHIVATNPPPTIKLTAPAVGSILTAPGTIILTADATDGDGIKSVTFYNGRRVISTVTKAPYTVTLNHAVAGTYTFSAVATDTYGQTTSSADAKVVVTR